jgi:transposase InsO family protein
MLNGLFYTFGSPENLVSDNGSQFASQEFQDFCKSLGINHIFTAPYHPQSNGQSERFVDTFKRALKKMKGEGG